VRGVTLTITGAADSFSGMALSSSGHSLVRRVVVLFAFGTLLGYVCVLEPGHHHPADASAWIGSAHPGSHGPLPIDEASCESLKPASVWPVIRLVDPAPLSLAGLSVLGSMRAGRAARVPVSRPPLFVLHAALLI
jgi:hypothetical protein